MSVHDKFSWFSLYEVGIHFPEILTSRRRINKSNTLNAQLCSHVQYVQQTSRWLISLPAGCLVDVVSPHGMFCSAPFGFTLLHHLQFRISASRGEAPSGLTISTAGAVCMCITCCYVWTYVGVYRLCVVKKKTDFSFGCRDNSKKQRGRNCWGR